MNGVFIYCKQVEMLTHYIGNITRVEPGQIVVIVGKTTDAATRLDLNLRSGKNKNDDIALNISVNFHEKVISRNARINGEWGHKECKENFEREDNNLNPIESGEIFKFYILICDLKFYIAVNNEEFCTFDYRMPVDLIRTVQIKYDLQFVTQVDHRSIFPTPFPPVQFDDARNIFSNDVPQPFKSGHVMVITGIPYGNPRGWFLIRFTEAASKRQALHFNVRFDPYFIVVRNNMNENGVFGAEERGGGFPFVLEQQFKLAIALTPKEFRFAVDGVHFTSFAYRSGHGIEKLNGFKMGTSHGLYLEITSVDHLQMDASDCDGFEEYSHPDYDML